MPRFRDRYTNLIDKSVSHFDSSLNILYDLNFSHYIKTIAGDYKMTTHRFQDFHKTKVRTNHLCPHLGAESRPLDVYDEASNAYKSSR